MPPVTLPLRGPGCAPAVGDVLTARERKVLRPPPHEMTDRAIAQRVRVPRQSPLIPLSGASNGLNTLTRPWAERPPLGLRLMSVQDP